jgi:prevent-host-death family protein
MSTISHGELRKNSADVLRRVEAGEKFVVTNHGEPVAELSPIHRSLLEELRAAGQTRPATRDRASLREIVRAKLPEGVTTEHIIADVRGY